MMLLCCSNARWACTETRFVLMDISPCGTLFGIIPDSLMSACFSAKVYASQYLVPAEGECYYSLPTHVAEKL